MYNVQFGSDAFNTLHANLVSLQAEVSGNFNIDFKESTMNRMANIQKYPTIYLSVNKTVKSPVPSLQETKRNKICTQILKKIHNSFETTNQEN